MEILKTLFLFVVCFLFYWAGWRVGRQTISDLIKSKITSLQVLPGDTLMFRYPETLAVEKAEQLQISLKEHFPQAANVIILSGGASAEVVNPGDVQELSA